MSPQEWSDHLVETAWKPVLQTHRHRQRRLHPHDRAAAHEPGRTSSGQTAVRQGRGLQGQLRGPVLRRRARSSSSQAELHRRHRDSPGRSCARSTAARSSTLTRGELLLPAVARTPTGCSSYYEANPDFVQPESARNEVVSFVRQGLQDLSISRSTFDWGIPVPVGRQARHLRVDRRAAELPHGRRLRRRATAERFAHTWPADVHLVGKDILRFHAVIWPAMLMAAGLPLPRHGLRATAGCSSAARR